MMNQQRGNNSRMNLRADWCGRAVPLGRALLIAILVLSAAPQPARSDQWEKVASGGLGDPGRNGVTALEVFDEAVYVAAHNLVTGRLSIHRAELRSDSVWVEVTPRFRNPATEVRDMLVMDDGLWACTTGGELWRRNREGRWEDLSPDYLRRGGSIFALAAWKPPGEASPRLVVASTGLALNWRKPDGRWQYLWGLIDPDHVHTDGAMGSLGDNLYLGLGGAPCQVQRFTPSRGWEVLTNNCFDPGTAPSPLNWVYGMTVFGGKIYIGTGGHGLNSIFRAEDADPEDVSPCVVYDACSPFDPPTRYADLKVSAGMLFTGVYNGGPAYKADVLKTVTGNPGDWARSNPPGFEVAESYGTFALASGGTNLYAAVNFSNTTSGFQIWRRNGMIHEMLLDIGQMRDTLLRESASWLKCLRRPRCHNWEVVYTPMQALSLTFDTARNQQEYPSTIQTIQWARQSMTGAVTLLNDAKKLADLADKTHNKKKATLLRQQAAEKVTTAINTAVEVCQKVGA